MSDGRIPRLAVCARALYIHVYTHVYLRWLPPRLVPQAVLQPHTVTIQPKLSLLESERARAREVGKTERQKRMRKRRGGIQRGGQVQYEEAQETRMRERRLVEGWEREARV
jgi:hypothetical protein